MLCSRRIGFEVFEVLMMRRESRHRDGKEADSRCLRPSDGESWTVGGESRSHTHYIYFFLIERLTNWATLCVHESILFSHWSNKKSLWHHLHDGRVFCCCFFLPTIFKYFFKMVSVKKDAAEFMPGFVWHCEIIRRRRTGSQHIFRSCSLLA